MVARARGSPGRSTRDASRGVSAREGGWRCGGGGGGRWVWGWVWGWVDDRLMRYIKICFCAFSNNPERSGERSRDGERSADPRQVLAAPCHDKRRAAPPRSQRRDPAHRRDCRPRTRRKCNIGACPWHIAQLRPGRKRSDNRAQRFVAPGGHVGTGSACIPFGRAAAVHRRGLSTE